MVSPRPDIFRLLCNDLKEALKEEEEEEEEEEQVDSMGIIGLSNKLFRETRKNQENFLAVNSFMERDSSSQAVWSWYGWSKNWMWGLLTQNFVWKGVG